jgi:hypothetical protein
MDIEGKPFSEWSLTVATSARDSHTIPFSFPKSPGETVSLFDGKQRTTAQTNVNTLGKAKVNSTILPRRGFLFIEIGSATDS